MYRPLATKANKWKSSCNIKDVQGYLQLPPKGDIVFITSSLKDIMVLYELGYPSIAFSSELIPTTGDNGKFVESIILQLKSRFKHVILYLDSDETGKTHSKKIEKKYGIDYILNPDNSPKDISDYILKYSRRKTKRMLNKLIKKVILKNENLALEWETMVASSSSNNLDSVNDNIMDIDS